MIFEGVRCLHNVQLVPAVYCVMKANPSYFHNFLVWLLLLLLYAVATTAATATASISLLSSLFAVSVCQTHEKHFQIYIISMLFRISHSNSIDGLVHESSSVHLQHVIFCVFFFPIFSFNGLALGRLLAAAVAAAVFHTVEQIATSSTLNFVKPFLFVRRMCALPFATHSLNGRKKLREEKTVLTDSLLRRNREKMNLISFLSMFVFIRSDQTHNFINVNQNSPIPHYKYHSKYRALCSIVL